MNMADRIWASDGAHPDPATAGIVELVDILRGISSIFGGFERSIALIDFVRSSEEKPPQIYDMNERMLYLKKSDEMDHWVRLAVTGAVFAVHGIKLSMKKISNIKKRKDLIRKYCDEALFNSSVEIFQSKLSDIESIRDVVAHPYDRISSKEDFNHHRVSSKGFDDIVDWARAQKYLLDLV